MKSPHSIDSRNFKCTSLRTYLVTYFSSFHLTVKFQTKNSTKFHLYCPIHIVLPSHDRPTKLFWSMEIKRSVWKYFQLQLQANHQHRMLCLSSIPTYLLFRLGQTASYLYLNSCEEIYLMSKWHVDYIAAPKPFSVTIFYISLLSNPDTENSPVNMPILHVSWQ